MGQRHIARASTLDRQRQTDQFGLHRIKGRGFGIDGNDTRLLRLRNPYFKRVLVLHQLIGAVAWSGLAIGGGRHWRVYSEFGPHLRQDSFKALFFKKWDQHIGIGALFLKFGDLVIYRYIGAERHQLTRNIGDVLLIMN